VKTGEVHACSPSLDRLAVWTYEDRRVIFQLNERMILMARTVVPLIAMFMALLAVDQAAGQYPRYVPPAGRTLPNELNYFRRDVGVLDQYNGFIAPLRQLDNQLQTMQNQQRADFRSAERAISQIRTSQAAPTGVGAGYMNYSHYYRLPSSPGRGAPR